MTREEREAIKARCDVLLAKYDKAKIRNLLIDTYALMDALDGSEMHVEYWNNMYEGMYSICRTIETERDTYKARVKALEKTFKLICDCQTCINNGDICSSCNSENSQYKFNVDWDKED